MPGLAVAQGGHARLCSVTSRAMVAAAYTAPWASLTGEIAREISIRVPSFLTRTVS